MLISRNKHFIVSVITGIAVFAVLFSVLFSLVQSRESNALKTRNINSMQDVSQMSEFMKFSIERQVLLLKGYEVYLMTNPDISEEETMVYLENLIGDDELIKNIGIIKGSTIIFNYPKEENLSAIGVDLLKVPAQRDAFNKVKITLQPLFFGPVELVQGGTGYIARTPVTVEGKYWGQVSVVLKADKVNELLQAYALRLNLEISLFKGVPTDTNIIFGDAGILNQEPILTTVSLMGSQYVIAAHEIDEKSIYEGYNILYMFALAFSLLLAFVVYLGLMKSNTIRVQASRDKLTQLNNRSSLDFFLKRVFSRVKSNGTKLGIVVMDIDNFKETNDQYGHLAGDAALQEISSNLLSVCRKTETVFRMGGDEFLIIFEDIASRETLETIVYRILNGVPSSVPYREFDIPLSVSAGYALYPEDGEEFDVLFKYADDQMYNNKKDKKKQN